MLRFLVVARRLALLSGTLPLLGACGGPETMIASSVLSAALETAVEQAEKNRPTPEQRWYAAQAAALEQRALDGDVDAQFRLGSHLLMLRDPAAERWICEAAHRGHAQAQLQYGHWFNEDRARDDLFAFIDVTPDNEQAYLWYSLAIGNGESRAPHFRDALARSGMHTQRIERARSRAARWTAGPCTTERPLTAAIGTPAAGRSAE